MKKCLKDVTKEEIDEGRVFLDTAFGPCQVCWINLDEWWVRVKSGRSFFCYPETTVLVKEV